MVFGEPLAPCLLLDTSGALGRAAHKNYSKPLTLKAAPKKITLSRQCKKDKEDAAKCQKKKNIKLLKLSKCW